MKIYQARFKGYGMAVLCSLFLYVNGVSQTSYGITWTDLVGVRDLSGNLTKYESRVSNGAAASKNILKFNSDGYFVFKAGDANATMAIGLSSENYDDGYQNIDYCFYFNANSIEIYESGSLKGNFGRYQTGDIFKIFRETGDIIYMLNGEEIFRNEEQSTSSLIIDVWIYTYQAYFYDISATFYPPIELSSISITQESLNSLGNINLAISGGISPYNIYWGTDTMLTDAELDSLLTDSMLSSLYSRAQLKSNLSTLYQQTSIKQLVSNCYPVTIIDSDGNSYVDTLVLPSQTLPRIEEGVTFSSTDNSFTKNTTISSDTGWVSTFNLIRKNSNDQLSFEINDDALDGIIGLRNLSDTLARSISGIQHGLYFNEGRVFEISGGSIRDGFETFADGDSFKINVNGDSIEYYKNDSLALTSPMADDGFIDFIGLDNGKMLKDFTSVSFMINPDIRFTVEHGTCGSAKARISANPGYYYLRNSLVDIEGNFIYCSNHRNNLELNNIGILPTFTYYVYRWYDSSHNLISNNPTLVDVTPGKYFFEVTGNYGSTLLSRTYIVEAGYKALWNVLDGFTVQGDSLVQDVAYSGDWNAISSNVLREDRDGWFEFSLPTDKPIHLVAGFEDQTLSNSIFFSDVIMFFNIGSANPTYKYNHNTVKFNGLGGTVFHLLNHDFPARYRIEKTGTVIKLYINGQYFTQRNITFDDDLTIRFKTWSDLAIAFDCIASFDCPNVYSYAKLKRELDGGYYMTYENYIYFEYDEEYHDNDGKLTYRVYQKPTHPIMSSELTGNPDIEIMYGDNRCKLDVSKLNADFYILEVTNQKNEKWYLRFKRDYNTLLEFYDY